MADPTSASIRIDIEPGLKAQGNEGQIHQVIINLVDNAIDAVWKQEKPVLEISARHTGREVVVDVADNGTGLSEAVIDKVFEPFFTTKPVGEGTGLGLWITYGMAREQGGS